MSNALIAVPTERAVALDVLSACQAEVEVLQARHRELEEALNQAMDDYKQCGQELKCKQQELKAAQVAVSRSTTPRLLKVRIPFILFSASGWQSAQHLCHTVTGPCVPLTVGQLARALGTGGTKDRPRFDGAEGGAGHFAGAIASPPATRA